MSSLVSKPVARRCQLHAAPHVAISLCVFASSLAANIAIFLSGSFPEQSHGRRKACTNADEGLGLGRVASPSPPAARGSMIF